MHIFDILLMYAVVYLHRLIFGYKKLMENNVLTQKIEELLTAIPDAEREKMIPALEMMLSFPEENRRSIFFKIHNENTKVEEAKRGFLPYHYF